MKGLHYLYTVSFSFILLCLTACVGEELSSSDKGLLRLQIASISTELSSNSQTKAGMEVPKTQLSTPEISAFKVRILQAGQVVKEVNSVTEDISLATGDYTVEVYSGGNPTPDSYTTLLPDYFIGSSPVTITSGETNNLEITAEWGYAVVYPTVETELSAHYNNYSLQVQVEGEEKQLITPSEDIFSPFYLLAGKNVSVSLVGENKAGDSKTQLLYSWNPVKGATEYNLSVSPDPNTGVFDFGLCAQVNHTTDTERNLNGTIVKLEMNTIGVPESLIQEFQVTLVNTQGETVRSYAKLINGTADMLGAEEWPYLPQGAYQLKYSYTINGKKVSNEANPISVTVPAPEFEVEGLSANTTYSLYKSLGAVEANAENGSSVFNISYNAKPKISKEILENPNYSNMQPIISYQFDGNPITDFNITRFDNLSWDKHILSANVSFDGVTREKIVDCHVTGLPYRFNFYNNNAALKNSLWTSVNVVYKSKKCAIIDDDNKGYLISPKYYLPEHIVTTYSIQAQYYRAWAINVSNETIDLRIGLTSSTSSVANLFQTHICPGDNNLGVSCGTYTGNLDMTPDAAYVFFHHNGKNITAQVDYLCLYEFVLKYK